MRKITLPSSVGYWWFIFLLVAVPILGVAGEPSKDIHPVNFDIPSLPLVQALARYGEASGFAVLVDSGMAAGRRSSPVKGYLDPYLALTYLLRGSGLTARYAGANAFTLVAKSAEVTRKPGTGNAGDVSTPGLGGHRFGAALQQALQRALCQTPHTRPGDYRAVIQLWLTKNGTVERLRLLGSTGSSRRDDAIQKQIRELRLATEANVRLPQPLTILILPGEGSSMTCRMQPASRH
ncbi:TonB C-terminal domain-containing protein [Serratia bockelmannii]|uniref:TonB C-terminal domain-containing protein n=1 Tax=Serratia bockelmannii TaxID=2703793 RepID=UPI002479DAE1|nr:TonB C-terminal domain-containing protein [Serratia bockelmannii]EIV2915659.1 TonB C-terminal domain-containing protein [Serratia marcescens]MDH7588963.1 TonB C-terminal domain-containing protein [Serratia bockelmannii]HAX9716073.1 TonB-dependent outer membrane receptor [Serratia marcescens]